MRWSSGPLIKLVREATPYVLPYKVFLMVANIQFPSAQSFAVNPGVKHPVNRRLVDQKNSANVSFGYDAFLEAEKLRGSVQAQASAAIRVGPARSPGIGDYLLHPIRTSRLKARLKENPQAAESYQDRMTMYLNLRDRLTGQGRKRLNRLMESGRLTRYQNAQDGRNTLAHLYSILTTPRAQDKYGSQIDPVVVIEDFLRLADNIETITQPFETLTNQNAQKLLDFYNNDPTSPYFKQQLTRADVEVAHSATCVSASMMASMIGEHEDMKQRPDVDYLAEFTRHLDGLTSARKAFTKRVSKQVLSPADPSQANEVISAYNLNAKPVGTTGAAGGSLYDVSVNLPEDAVIRAVNAQQSYTPGKRGIVEAVVQSAYTHLVDPNYVPGLDHRVTNGNIEDIPGIEADRKQLLESIAVGQPIVSIQYQFTAVDRPDGQPYLIGYTRPLKDTQNDILDSLKMGKKPIVGVIWTDDYGPSTGRIPGGHEFLIVDAQQRQDGWYFKIYDSDDGVPHAVWKSARDIIPRIHHVGLPLPLAQRVQTQMAQLGDTQYLVPDMSDAVDFDLIKTLPYGRHKTFLDAYQRLLAADEGSQPATATAAPQPPQATQPVAPSVTQPAYNPYTAYTQPSYIAQATYPTVAPAAYPAGYGTYPYPTSSYPANSQTVSPPVYNRLYNPYAYPTAAATAGYYPAYRQANPYAYASAYPGFSVAA
ncbi:MAG: hypothetical protein KC474_09555 [Cyanobacteria bacterium HKST-UBA04]|nr:hypothetical protein [Cyanobacteria bacterium HKST-UBA04]